MFLSYGIRVDDKYFDAYRKSSKPTFDGGMIYIITDYADKLPPLSNIFDPHGVDREMGPNKS
eukprot:8610290-Ditylum_brightwellii.AAC.1